MRAPPPVEIPSSLGRAWRGALSLLVGASAAVPLAWCLPRVAALEDTAVPTPLFALIAEPVVQGGLAGTAAVLVCVAAWWASGRFLASERTLRWDGQAWALAERGDRHGLEGDVALMLDLGPWMLVRFVPTVGRAGAWARRARWLTLTQGVDLDGWTALRGALWTWRAGAAPHP